MQLGCTKKVLEYLKLPAVPADPGCDPFFSWSANLVTLHNRDTLVVANDYSRCWFFLYGVTAEVTENLEAYISAGIRNVLEYASIAPEQIQAYMENCGAGLHFTKMPNRMVVARLNHCSRCVSWMDQKVDSGKILQSHLTELLNQIPVMVEGKYEDSVELLRAGFREHGTGQQQKGQYEALELTITLQLSIPCSRVICVNSTFTLYDLHGMIQALFFWQNSHMHEFCSPEGEPLEEFFPEHAHLLQGDAYYSDYTRMERAITLQDVFERSDCILYVYDMGDSWQHEIVLTGRQKMNRKPLPACLKAEGTPPPEDVGGMEGYEDFLQILADPDDEEYEDTLSWAEEQGWSPDCTLEKVRRRFGAGKWMRC